MLSPLGELSGNSSIFLQFHSVESKSESPLSRVQLFATPWTVVRQENLWDSPGQNTECGYPIPSPGDLPDPGIEPKSPTL